MSRSPVPGNKLNKFVEAKKQICVYSFPLKALQFLTENPQKSSVEEIEDIEILRFLERFLLILNRWGIPTGAIL